MHVVGVDGSTRIADVAKRLVAANGMADSDGGSITVLQGRLEELPSLPIDQVLTRCVLYSVSGIC